MLTIEQLQAQVQSELKRRNRLPEHATLLINSWTLRDLVTNNPHYFPDNTGLPKTLFDVRIVINEHQPNFEIGFVDHVAR